MLLDLLLNLVLASGDFLLHVGELIMKLLELFNLLLVEKVILDGLFLGGERVVPCTNGAFSVLTVGGHGDGGTRDREEGTGGSG